MKTLIRASTAACLVTLLVACGAVSNKQDPDGDTDGDTGPTGPLTIYEIRNPAEARHPQVGTTVTLTGKIVTAVAPVDKNGRIQFWIAEPNGGEWSGIYVYDQTKIAPDVHVGDEVTVKGAYSEFVPTGAAATEQPISEISMTATTVTANGLTTTPLLVPAAELSTIATGGTRAEALEGVLVQIDGEVQVVELTDLAHGEYRVGTSLANSVRVDDTIYPDAEEGRGLGQPITKLVGVMYYSYGDVKFEPRDANDIVAGAIPVLDATVYDLRDTSLATAVPPGSLVRLTGMVVTAIAGTGTGAFWAQLPESAWSPAGDASYSGIYVFRSTNAANTTVAVGDVVTVEGAYSEYPAGEASRATSLSEVAGTTVTVTASGAALPTPAVVNPADIKTAGATAEAFESVLVRVEAIFVTTANPDAGVLPDPGDFLVTGDLRVSPDLWAGATVAGRAQFGSADAMTAVQGPLYFRDGNTRILPRAAADLDTTRAPYPLATVRELQLGTTAAGTKVSLKDVVVTTLATADGRGDFVVQMLGQTDTTYSGIYCTRLGTAVARVAVGSRVVLQGTYTEAAAAHPGLTVFEVETIAVQGTADVPAATVVTPAAIATGGADAAKYESVLVAVDEVAVTTASPDATDIGDFEVTGGLRVGSVFFGNAAAWGRAATSGFTRITGALYWGDSRSVLAPRDAGDMTRKSITYVDASVYSVQDPADATPVTVGSQVRLSDLVVTAVVGDGSLSFFGQLSDAGATRGPAYSGIFFDRGATPKATVVHVGDLVRVTGQYAEDAATLQSVILVDGVEVTGAGTRPTPVAITDTTLLESGTAAESYEGVLVAISEADLLAINPDEPADRGAFLVATAADTVGLRVGDMTFAGATVSGRQSFAGFTTLTGVLAQLGVYELEPTASADLVARPLPLTPIYDLQDPAGTRPVGKGVRVEGVVVTGVVGVGDDDFFVEMSDTATAGDGRGKKYSGIYCVRTAIAASGTPVVVAVGDVVDLDGLLVEAAGVTALNVTHITNKGPLTGADGTVTKVVVPAAELVAPATADAYEGVLVEVDAVTLATPFPTAADEITVGGGGGEIGVGALLWPTMAATARYAVAGFDAVVGPLGHDAGGYKLEPRGEADLVASAIPTKTIYQLRDPADGAVVGMGVKLEGVVVTAFQSPSNAGGFWVQIPDVANATGGMPTGRDSRGAQYSAIYCERSPILAAFTVARDQVLTLEGTYLEVAGRATLRVTRITKFATTPATSPVSLALIADPSTLATAATAEAYESVLVKVSNVSLVTANPDDPDAGEIVVTGGLRVGSLMVTTFAGTARTVTTFGFIQGPLYYSGGAHKIEPRTWGDVDATFPATLYQLQDPATTFPVPVCGTSCYGPKVRVTNLIVTGLVDNSPTPTKANDLCSFYAQVRASDAGYTGPAYSGIFVYRGTKCVAAGGTEPNIHEGDVVDVLASVQEYYGMTELSATAAGAVTIVSSGNAVPAPVDVTVAAIATGGADVEKYESVLVRVGPSESPTAGLVLVSAAPDANDYGEFTVGPAGTTTGGLRVDDGSFADSETIGRAATTFTSITGNLFWGNNNAKLEPRRAADIVTP